MGPPKRLLLNRKPTSLRSPQLGAPVLLDSPAVWRASWLMSRRARASIDLLMEMLEQC
ncbi:Hypothetical protein SMAX5B_017863 [Scophthalmus maximus]|uniref:Uncharacterized protein n=1 Tax=Scophthalmus maximus TaxID=52904 RepID=A0A2U9C1X8_SCOMX|nr:Hypothetical protein SMAX5B_017863 [Scophthalmus maximus]